MTVENKRQRLDSVTHGPEDFSADILELLLDETERALLLVDARVDEPGKRVIDGDAPEDAELSEPLQCLRLAMAETVDANSGVQYELERVSDRLRSAGATAAAAQLAFHPHLCDLARLAIESFFVSFPDYSSFELAQQDPMDDDYGRSAQEVYDSLRELLESLRARMS